MKILITYFLIFIVSLNNLNAQINYDFGKVSKEEIARTDYGKFNGSDAIFLYNNLDITSYRDFERIYYPNGKHIYHKRIKILTEKALELNQWSIEYNTNQKEKVPFINAEVYNIENGKKKITKLQNSDIETLKLNDSIVVKTISLRNVKVGSVIELLYETALFREPKFSFQQEYPVLKARFKPLNKLKLVGELSDLIEIKELKEKKFILNQMVECSEWFFLGYNLPAYSDISQITKIEFGKRSIFKPEYETYMAGKIHPGYIYKDWYDMAKDLNDFFYFQRSGFKRDAIIEEFKYITDKDISEFEKIQQIVFHIRDNYEITNKTKIHYKGLLIKEVFLNKKGTPYELNILAGTVFLYNKIKAVPMIVSTYSPHTFIDSIPSIMYFDHLIWKYTEDNGSINYIDVRNKHLPFNMVPNDMIGGIGFSFYYGKPGFEDFAKNVKTNKTNYVSNILISPEKINQNVSITLKDYAVSEFKSSIETHKDSVFNYFTNSSVKNIDWGDYTETGKPIEIKFDYEKKLVENEDIVFNPFENIRYNINPMLKFKLEGLNEEELSKTKLFFSLLENENKKITVNIPEGYKIKKIPENLNSTFENSVISKIYYHLDDNKISILSILKTKKLIFDSDNYDLLFKIFDEKINKEKEVIILEKM